MSKLGVSFRRSFQENLQIVQNKMETNGRTLTISQIRNLKRFKVPRGSLYPRHQKGLEYPKCKCLACLLLKETWRE